MLGAFYMPSSSNLLIFSCATPESNAKMPRISHAALVYDWNELESMALLLVVFQLLHVLDKRLLVYLKGC
jgi:hypothetical protein